MKKKLLIITIIMTLTLTGCVNDFIRGVKDGYNDGIREGSKTTETTEETTEAIEESKFDTLDEGIQALLITGIIDWRVEEYRNLELMKVYYYKEGNDIYTHLTSEAGIGHPFYYFKIDGNNITFVDGVVNRGIDGYEAVEEPSKTTTKDILYREYLQHKEDYDISVANIKSEISVIESYKENTELIGIKPEQ